MGYVDIDDLPAASELDGTEPVEIIQSGANKQTTTQDIADLGGGGSVPGAWTAYTPTLTQSGAVTKTVTRAKWVQIGKTVHVNVFLTVTGTGTANNTVIVGLPVASLVTDITVGAGRIYDSSAGAVYRAVIVLPTTTTIRLEGTNTTVGNGLGGTGQPFTAALASGDVVEFTATYEVA